MNTVHREPSWSFGPFVIDCARRTLSRNGEPVAITPKAFDILAVLAASGGQLVTKEALIRAVWPDTTVDEGSLTFQISTLRKALDDRATGSDRYIATVPGRGYQLVKPVERVSGEPGVEITEAESQRAQRKSVALIGMLAAAVIMVSIGAVLVLRREERPAIPPRTVQTLAVLPFKPLVASERDEALELGMAETLIARISSLAGQRPDPETELKIGREQSLPTNAVTFGRHQPDVLGSLSGRARYARARARPSSEHWIVPPGGAACVLYFPRCSLVA